MIRVHNFARGARGVRIFWQCEEMGLPYERAVVSYPLPPAYKALNPIGNVPFLEDEGGVAINESVAIMLYLAERYGPTPLLPRDDPALLARVLQLVEMSEASIGGALNTLMAAHFMAPDDDKRNWSIRGAEQRVEDALGFVSRRLNADGYLAGDRFTLADIAVVTALGMWQGALGKAIPEALVEYRARMMARPGYQRAAAQPPDS